MADPDPEYPFAAPAPPAKDAGRTIQTCEIVPRQAATATLKGAMKYGQPLLIESRCGVPAEVIVESARSWAPNREGYAVEIVVSVQPKDSTLPATSVRLAWKEPLEDPELSRPPRPGEMKIRRDSLGRILTVEKG